MRGEAGRLTLEPRPPPPSRTPFESRPPSPDMTPSSRKSPPPSTPPRAPRGPESCRAFLAQPASEAGEPPTLGARCASRESWWWCPVAPPIVPCCGVAPPERSIEEEGRFEEVRPHSKSFAGKAAHALVAQLPPPPLPPSIELKSLQAPLPVGDALPPPIVFPSGPWGLAMAARRALASAGRDRASAVRESENSKSASMIWSEEESVERAGTFALARWRRFWNQTWIWRAESLR